MTLLIAIVLLSHGVMAMAAEGPQDFAYAMPIHADGRDALYEFEIPAAVYRSVTRSDLGDLRVFNGQGEVVPHAFRPRPTSSPRTPPAVSLPLFPLYAKSGSGLDNLNVRVQKKSDGTIVNIVSQAKGVAEKQHLRAYVLDASGLRQPIQALSFDWKSAEESFVGKVRIEGSDDLTRWVLLVENASLVSLEFGGHRLQQKRVELNGQKYKYLRLSWHENQPPLERLIVSAELAAGIVEAQRIWQTITATTGAGKAGEYAYDLGGFFPLDRMRVGLPQVNTLVQVTLLARAKPSEDWRLLASAVTYRLRHQGEEVISPDVAVRNGANRYWLLRVDQKGGGVGQGVPTLNIGWVPQKMVFAARGAGPFQLAYGSVRAKSASYPINSLIPGYQTETEFKIQAASLGEQLTLAGAQRLRESIDYKKWALWATLLVGVALLGAMAYRLLRQVSKAESRGVQSETSDKPK